jgi:hypothetical protein
LRIQLWHSYDFVFLFQQFLIPIEYVVECRTEVLDSYGRPALVKDFAILYGVLLRLNEKTMGSCSHCSATIRGSQHEIGRLKEAVNHLMKLNQNLVYIHDV